MFSDNNDLGDLGAKVQRAHLALRQVRGVGVANGVRVVVDSENRLLSVTVDDEADILAAYKAALRDKEPKTDEAMRELRADPRFEAVSTFVEANAARQEADRARRQREREEAEDRFFEERNRRGWFDR
ncbi:YbaB/EbfC family nucleoid-associated protein [Nocardia terpenica]|uniref:YbaB/EbfC family nucleoid-associated protein n=1 Tax=Nocardia terpenica TaxID=455432 RepID=UPI0012FE2B3E|nr:YbaB/EbfC family nucleoid-associated protein [Nocardia terpenica]